MQKLIPNTDGLFINELCEIFIDGNAECDLQTVGDKILVPFKTGARYLLKEFVVLLAWFEIPEDIDIDNVGFFHLPIKRKTVKFGAAFRRPYTVFENFRRLAAFPRIAVSKDGNCVNSITGKPVHGNVNRFGYRCVDTYDPLVEKWRSVPVHILVAQAWIPNVHPSIAYIVNHIDGDKMNNSVLNLEWCTYSHNNKHAVLTGLSTQARPCCIRDIYSGEIYKMPSLQAAADFLKLRGRATHFEDSTRANRLYCGKYEIRLSGDATPWFYTEDKQFVNPGCASQFVYVITGVADRPIVCNGGTCFKNHFKLWNVNSSIALLEKFTKLYPDAIVEVIDQGGIQPVEVFDTNTGKIVSYESQRETSRALGIAKTIVAYLVSSDGASSYKGYRMRYKNNVPWCEEKKIIQPAIRLIVKVKETGESQEYPSIRAVMRSFHMTRAHVLRHVAHGLPTDTIEISVLD